MVRRKKHKVGKVVLPFVAAGVGLGVGALAVSKIGGSTAANVGQGLSTASGFIPIAGTVVGAGMTVKALGLLHDKKRKRRF